MTWAGRDRRHASRVPVGFYLQQIVDGDPHRCFTTNLSASGCYMERVLTPMERLSPTVQVELPLPGLEDPLWARAEVVYDCFDALFHGTAVRFVAMAGRHRRMLRDWLRQRTLGTLGSGRQVVRAAPGIDIFRPPPRPAGR